MIDRLFSFCLHNKSRIIFVFKLLYLLQITLLIIGAQAIYFYQPSAFFYYQIALWCGRVAILVYILTTIPGMMRRFGIHHKAIGIIMLFRRYIGISMYLLVFIHYWLVRGIDMWLRGRVDLSLPGFQLFGFIAYLCLLAMFLTSNDLSVSKLGIWWSRLHKLTYVIVWLIFLHVALQSVSIWSVLIGVTAVAQISSHAFSYFRKKQMTVSLQ